MTALATPPSPADLLLARVRALGKPRAPVVVTLDGWQPYPEQYRRLVLADYSPTPPGTVDNGCYRDLECVACGSSGPQGVHLFRNGRSLRLLVRCINCNASCEC